MTARFLTLFILIFPTVSSGWNLTQLAVYDSPNHELLDVEISGEYAFVPAGLGGLNIIDISDPERPYVVSEYHGYGCDWGRLYAWHVSGDYAYGAGRECGIKVIDVSDSGHPSHAADYTNGGTGQWWYEQIDGHHSDGRSTLFAAVHTRGVEIVNASIPEAPMPLVTVPTENAWAVKVSDDGKLVYVADGAGGLKIINVADLHAPEIIGEAEASGVAKDVEVYGSYAFAAVGAAGVDMFDVSDPASPILVANYNTSGYASRVAVSDDLVAVSDWDDVEVLRWDSTPSLKLVGYKNTGGRVMALNMVNDIIYSAEWKFFRTFKFGEIEAADIDISGRYFDFPYTASGECRDTIFTVRNSGGDALTISNVELEHRDYSVYLPKMELRSGETAEVSVTYCASESRGWTPLRFSSDDPDEPEVAVRLEGNSDWGIEAGQTAPDFTLSKVNGDGDLTLTDLRSNPVLVAFFASW